MVVLVADDHSEVRSALRLLLSQEQWVGQVREATTCDNLLDGVREACPDLLLLDWELPGLDCAQILAQVRSICPQVLVVALSGRPEARQAAISAGADAFLSKGEPPDRVLTTLCSVVERVRN